MKLLENWLGDDSFGAPLACVATSFTFDADFFSEDCLIRFLRISTRDSEGASGTDIAGLIEEEERLRETTICVLVDQSYEAQRRNLRWDVLPVRVPGGLLHAKVVILVWEHVARVIIGSANLTPAGYRSQVELALPIDLTEGCVVPQRFFLGVSTEVRSLLNLTPGDPRRPGPKQRVLAALDLFDQRVRTTAPLNGVGDLRIELAPAGKNTNPLDMLDTVWKGARPHSVMMLSPFWDDTDDMPGVKAVLSRPSPRRAPTEATFVLGIDPRAVDRTVQAPVRLRSAVPEGIEARAVAFGHQDDRRLHAKCVQYWSDDWIATMFGSSNITAKGLGIDTAPHREMNVWLGCDRRSPTGKQLWTLVPEGDELDGSEAWATGTDEDEQPTGLHPLPTGFGEALLVSRTALELGFTGASLPSGWSVHLGPRDDTALVDARTYGQADAPATWSITLENDLDQLPSALHVRWNHRGEERFGMWLVNLADGAFLPPPSELRELSAEVLLAILASTRPLRPAVEDALRKVGRGGTALDAELDLLKRFDSSGFLLQRTRRTSAALYGVERRLSQPIHSMDALEWRLSGTLGPEHLATRLVEAAAQPGALAGEAEFLLAELALTVYRVPWAEIRRDLPNSVVRARVRHTIGLIADQLERLDSTDTDPALREYIDTVMNEVKA